MIYRHKFFSLDSDLQNVYDSNGNELRIISDMYLLLLALCEKKSMSLIEVDDILGLSREYHGRRVEEDVEKINHIIGSKIVLIEDVEGEFETETIISLKDKAIIKE